MSKNNPDPQEDPKVGGPITVLVAVIVIGLGALLVAELIG